MSATPETYRGVLEKAQKGYEEALKFAQHAEKDGYIRDEEGFIILRKFEDIDQAIEDLARLEGFLDAKINDFSKSGKSKKKPEYEKMKSKISCLLAKIKKVRKELRHN